MTRLWLRMRWAVFFLGIAALWLLPVAAEPDGFPIWVGGEYSDLLVSHWPNAHWLRRSLTEWGQIPLWNPQILSGAPFASDPLSGLSYPPTWLAAWFPGGLGFTLVFWFHLAWAGLGAARLARAGGVGWAGAALAGIAYCGTPKLIGHIGLGHLGLVCSAAWTPWLLLATRRAFESPADVPRAGRHWAALAGAALGATFLADPRWAAPTGLLVLTMSGYILSQKSARPPGWGRAAAGQGLVLGLTAAGTAAALALPLLTEIPLTTRAALAGADRFALSLSPERLMGLLVPDLGGWPEALAFVGLGPLFLALAALLTRSRGAWFWAGVALGGWVLALGAHTPLYSLLARMPGFDLLRVPARFLLASSLAIAILAGNGLDALVNAWGGDREKALRLGLVAAGAACLILGLAGAVVAGDNVPGFWLTALVGLMAASLGMLTLTRWRSAAFWSTAWLVLVVAELLWVDTSLLEVRSAPEALGERTSLIHRLAAELEPGQRLFSPSYSLPQQAAASAGLELADGVNPLQLAAYVQAMRPAVGIEDTGYSVTLPPFVAGDPSIDWNPSIDPGRLGYFAVGLVVSEFPLSASGLEELPRQDGVWVYRNLQARPRAWVQDSEEITSEWRSVDEWEWAPNQIRVTAEGPGVLVFSEVVFPRWRATIDAESAPLLTVAGVLRGVHIGAGTHSVELTFHPWPVYLGAALTLATVLALAFVKGRA